MAIKDNGLGESWGVNTSQKRADVGFPFRSISGGSLMVTGTWEEGPCPPSRQKESLVAECTVQYQASVRDCEETIHAPKKTR